jgi:hypothetical protein
LKAPAAVAAEHFHRPPEEEDAARMAGAERRQSHPLRENTLQDVITKIETGLFETVTGLTVKDFHLLVRLRVFNTEQMNQAVFAFRRYEDASLRYTGIESHKGLSHYGLYDTVVARE